MKATPRLPDANVNLPREHPLSEFAFLTLGIGLLVGAAALLVYFFVELVVAVLPYDVEARMLGSLEHVAARDPGADEPDPRLMARTERLQALLDGVGRGWPDNPYRMRVAILEAEELNAFAAPGGHIFVTTGLLAKVESENELAFVLAHELGHYKGRDHLRGLGRQALWGLLLTAAGLDNGGASFIWTGAGLMSLRFDRAQEEAADGFGLELLQARYGHVAGSFDFFERLDQGPHPLGRVPAFLQTHPTSKRRVALLHARARERGFSQTGALRMLDDDDALRAVDQNETQ